MSLTTRESSALAATLVVAVLLFSLLNGIPWAAKAELVETKIKVERLEVKATEHDRQLSTLIAQQDDVRKRLDRIESKLDSIIHSRFSPIP